MTPDGKISTVFGPGIGKEEPRCPTGVAVNRRGEIFAADPCRRQILILRNEESAVFAGLGDGHKEPSGAGGPASAAAFDEWGLALTQEEDLIVSGPDYGHVYRIGRDGNFSVVAGTGSWRAQLDGAQARDTSFQHLSHLAIGQHSSIYVTDFGGDRIYRIAQNGEVTRLAGTGRPFYRRENVAAAE